jgi:REP element-mobilizing transposase RayT
MPDDAIALFLTWTTYGTWLPGDRRGHVSNQLRHTGGCEPKQNRPGTPYAPGDAHTRKRARNLQAWPTCRLNTSQAIVAAQSFIRLSLQHEWMLLRGAIMPNHVHVVVTKCPLDGPAIRRTLKGATQAELSKETGQPQRWWTAGGSDRIRRGEQSINATIRYVADQPGKLVEIIENRLVLLEPSEQSPDHRG